MTKTKEPPEASTLPLVRRHLRVGWWAILFFLTLGVVLEALHGFKVPWYLNVANETRRLMLTLAHAHGVLVGLLHIAFAATVRLRRKTRSAHAQEAKQPINGAKDCRAYRHGADIDWIGQLPHNCDVYDTNQGDSDIGENDWPSQSPNALVPLTFAVGEYVCAHRMSLIHV